MIERLLYVVLFLSIMVNIGLGVLLYGTEQRINNQTAQIEGYMRCIVLLFTKPDRANLVVTNIDKCSTMRKQ
jgi:hypothetical protein